MNKYDNPELQQILDEYRACKKQLDELIQDANVLSRLLDRHIEQIDFCLSECKLLANALNHFH